MLHRVVGGVARKRHPAIAIPRGNGDLGPQLRSRRWWGNTECRPRNHNLRGDPRLIGAEIDRFGAADCSATLGDCDLSRTRAQLCAHWIVVWIGVLFSSWRNEK